MRMYDVVNDLTDKTDLLCKDLFDEGSFIIVKRFTSSSVKFTANAAQNVLVPITVPSGYRYLTTTAVLTNGNVLSGYYMSFNSSASNVSTWVKNWSTSQSFSATVSVDVLFIKEEL